MGDDEDNMRYPQKAYSLNRQKLPMHTRQIPKRHEFYQEEEDEEEEEDDEFGDYSQRIEEGVNRGGENPNGYYRNIETNEGFGRYPKRQKIRTSGPGYDFAGPSEVKLSNEWTEHEAFVLLEVWGDRFLQLGRKSLRTEDWVDVGEKVSEELRVEKSETQCRKMMDSLKRKYKKEMAKSEKLGSNSSKWVFFKKMDMLLGSSSRQDCGLACGVDSGEFVFMNTRVYLDRSNGFDEMMDSPADSEMEGDDEDGDGERRRGDSYKLLADSVQSFGNIYEKVETSKRENMKELEKMRVEFHRDLELQKKQILENAEAEIARLQEEEEEEEEEEEQEEEEQEEEEEEDDEDDDDDAADDNDEDTDIDESAENLSD